MQRTWVGDGIRTRYVFLNEWHLELSYKDRYICFRTRYNLDEDEYITDCHVTDNCIDADDVKNRFSNAFTETQVFLGHKKRELKNELVRLNWFMRIFKKKKINTELLHIYKMDEFYRYERLEKEVDSYLKGNQNIKYK